MNIRVREIRKVFLGEFLRFIFTGSARLNDVYVLTPCAKRTNKAATINQKQDLSEPINHISSNPIINLFSLFF